MGIYPSSRATKSCLLILSNTILLKNSEMVLKFSLLAKCLIYFFSVGVAVNTFKMLYHKGIIVQNVIRTLVRELSLKKIVFIDFYL